MSAGDQTSSLQIRPSSELTGGGQRAKVNAPRRPLIEPAFETAGEMSEQHFHEALSLYCRWMIRLYLEHDEQHEHEPTNRSRLTIQ